MKRRALLRVEADLKRVGTLTNDHARFPVDLPMLEGAVQMVLSDRQVHLPLLRH